jgi:arabinogalactan endo-1,4-beta-galactosidase
MTSIFPHLCNNGAIRLKFWVFLISLLLLCTYAWRLFADNANMDQKLFSYPVSFEKSYFGLHVQDPHGTAIWPNVGVGGVRLFDNYVNWANLEPKKGEWHFEDLDRLVNKARENGADVLLVLGQTPSWASARPNESSPYFPGNAAEPADIEDWKQYVRTVATRYRGKISAYEIWNEANLKMFWSGNFIKMAELEREAYKVLKSIDPSITVVSASLTLTTKQTLNDYFSAGNGKFADVIGYHFYTPEYPPEPIFLKYMPYLRDALDKYGLGTKPIWNTETGWLISEDDGHFSDGRISTLWKTWARPTPEQAAGYVIRALLIERLAGIKRFYWYGWDHNGLGLTSGLGQSTRKAGLGYIAAMRWFVGSQVKNCAVEGDVWNCQLTKGNKKGWILWSISKPSKIPPAIISQAVWMEDYLGVVRKVSNDHLVSEVPIMLFAQQTSW